MVLICLYNLIMNVGRMWGECVEECEDECGDQCGDSFTVVILSSYGIQTEMCCLQGLCVGKS